MGSLIHELDNDALVMLYLADELSPEDRTDMEQLLQVDAGLRAELAAVQADGEAASAAMAMADRVDPPAGLSSSAEAVALRRVGRAMRQFQVDTLVRNRPVVMPETPVAFPVWTYRLAGVAAALAVGLGWWGWVRHSSKPTLGGPGQNQFADSRGPWGPQSPGFGMFGDAFGFGIGSTPSLANAEREAYALRQDQGDPSELPSVFGPAAMD